MRASEVIWSLVKDSLEALKKKVVEIVDTSWVICRKYLQPLHKSTGAPDFPAARNLDRSDLLAAAWRLVMLFDRFVADGSSKALNRASS